MTTIRAYQITVGLLIALLIVLNLVVPYVKRQRLNQKMTALVEYSQSIKSQQQQEKGKLLTAYIAQNGIGGSPQAAKADNLPVCDLNWKALENVMNWWNEGPSDRPMPDVVHNLLVILVANDCGEFL